MHIVYLSREYVPSLRGGGIASYVKEAAENFVKRGHAVSVICASDDTTHESDNCINGVRVIRLSGGDFVVQEKENKTLLRKFRCLYRFHSYRKKILSTLQTLGHIDIIEAGEFGAEAFYLSSINIPVVIRLHTPTLLDRDNAGIKRFKFKTFYDYWIGRQELKIMPQFKFITSCSMSLRNWFKEYVPDLYANIEIVYNPIDIDNWITSDNQYKENTVLFVGTVSEVKGVGDLIEACYILRQEMNIPVTLNIAGKIGSYAMELQREVETKNYEWCHFLGNQSRDSLKELYLQSKVSCFPSRWEAMGIVCTEAMLAGNIVIGSSNGGMAEIIDNGVNGYLVPPHNPGVLAECLKKALNMDDAAIKFMRRNAHEKIRKNFSMDVILEQMEKYYLNVIDEYGKS